MNTIPLKERLGETAPGADATTDTNIIVPQDTPSKRRFVKTNIPNLIRREPMGA
jgi:hypothetical protein